MLGILIGIISIFSANHLLMQLFAWPDANNLLASVWSNHPGQVCHFHGRDFLHIDLPTDHILKSMPYQLNTLLQRDHEASHARIGDRQHAFVLNRHKKRDHRAARPHHISVAHHREFSVMATGI